jgi:hypothetical protein
LQRKARGEGRTTAEYLRLYALEGFLLRLVNSQHANRFVLKGGVLLAAYQLRRPNHRLDFAGVQVSNDVEAVRQLVVEVASTVLSTQLDDGLTFDLENVRAETIREDDEYSGVRVRLVATLATAKETFHVDVNVGDPILPPPTEISLPRLLEQAPIRLQGYPLEMVLAENRHGAPARFCKYSMARLWRRVPAHRAPYLPCEGTTPSVACCGESQTR